MPRPAAPAVREAPPKTPVSAQAQSTPSAAPSPTDVAGWEKQPAFEGWYFGVTEIQPLMCPFSHEAWTQSGTWAQCCTSTQLCPMATGCKGNQILLDDGNEGNCTDPDNTAVSCVVMTVLPSYGVKTSQTATFNAFCGENWVASTIFREIPESSSSTSSSTSIPTSSTTHFTSSSIAASSTSGALSTSTTAAASGSGGGSSSKAWIAGAVVGPLAGIALILAGVWFLFRKRRTPGETAAPAAAAYHDDQNKSYYGGNYHQGYPMGSPAPTAGYSDWNQSQGGQYSTVNQGGQYGSPEHQYTGMSQTSPQQLSEMDSNHRSRAELQ